jgi:hypothetical protein
LEVTYEAMRLTVRNASVDARCLVKHASVSFQSQEKMDKIRNSKTLYYVDCP